MKNALIDVCDEIESGATLSEAMGKVAQGIQPAVCQHDQGRRGGRCPGSHSAASGRVPGTVGSLKRKVKGALVYPITVVIFAAGILAFIMIKIVPNFEKIFRDFNTDLPAMTKVLMATRITRSTSGIFCRAFPSAFG